jgi:hypothetical protein
MGAVIVMASIMADPFLFQNMWFKRWFRICWWLGIVIAISATVHPPNGAAP